jgi:hypothetical protein
MERGAMADYLENYAGGIKALVRDERALRRAERPAKTDRQDNARAALKAATAMAPEAVVTDADGLAVVIARREGDGTLAIVAALPQGTDLCRRVVLATQG